MKWILLNLIVEISGGNLFMSFELQYSFIKAALPYWGDSIKFKEWTTGCGKENRGDPRWPDEKSQISNFCRFKFFGEIECFELFWSL